MSLLRCAPLLLMAEDDVDAAQLFRHLFLKVCPDWEFVWVGNGLEAVAYMMDNAAPDVVVTDLQMPQMTGQELICWLRASRDFSRFSIMVLSGQCCPEFAIELRKNGADECLCKPSSLRELKEIIARLTFLTSNSPGYLHGAALA